jgi:hypothetical protein
VRAEAALHDGDMASIRRSIAGRYLGADAGARFAMQRVSRPGVLLRLVPEQPRVWDLAGVLPE